MQPQSYIFCRRMGFTEASYLVNCVSSDHSDCLKMHKKFSFFFKFSVYINKSGPRIVLFWWKCCRHSATSVFNLSFLWAPGLYRGLSSWSCVFSSFGLVPWLSGSDLPHLRLYPRGRSQSRSYLVGFFNTHKSRAPLNGSKGPHIISRRTLAVWSRGAPCTTFPWRR